MMRGMALVGLAMLGCSGSATTFVVEQGAGGDGGADKSADNGAQLARGQVGDAAYVAPEHADAAPIEAAAPAPSATATTSPTTSPSNVPPDAAPTAEPPEASAPPGPITITCVVATSCGPQCQGTTRYVCEGMYGDNDQGVDYASAVSTNGAIGTNETCSPGHAATVVCPSGAYCRVYTSSGTLQGSCL